MAKQDKAAPVEADERQTAAGDSSGGDAGAQSAGDSSVQGGGADTETGQASSASEGHGGEAPSTVSSDAAGQQNVSNGSGNSGTTEDPSEALRLRIQELEHENTELKNQYLRKQADMENYRKRMVRDKENAVQFSNQQLLLDLTSVIDDFERAIRSAEESRDYDSFHDGIVLIENQLTGMLERKWGLKRFESEGEVFDPQKHEAMTTEPRDDHTESIVMEDYQKGYMLHDRVLRPAKVKVSMPGGDTEETKE